MKKKFIISGVMAVIALVAFFCFGLSRPERIEQNVIDIGSTNIVSKFDEWQGQRTGREGGVPVTSLPACLQKLNPLSARLTVDGLYVVMQQNFVEEDGVFIVGPHTQEQFNEYGDPAYYRISERIYRYHISG